MSLRKLLSRKTVADTVTSVTYGIGFGAVNELMISGLSLEEFAKTRAMSTTLNITMGRPYGAYIDLLYRKFGLDEDSPFIKRAATDVAALISFWTPIYCGILYASGGDRDKITHALLGYIAISPVVGKSYTWYLEKVRSSFGVQGGQHEISSKL